uniref:Nucleolar protein 7 n=1 Tax=Coturnix japonica TaxID=93934 RepID=A0A8C2U0X1_COTJA
GAPRGAVVRARPGAEAEAREARGGGGAEVRAACPLSHPPVTQRSAHGGSPPSLRRHRELLKEKRRRRQELFTEQKVPRSPAARTGPGRPGPASSPLFLRREGKLLPEPCCRSWPQPRLQRADEPSPPAAPDNDPEGESAEQSETDIPRQVKKDKAGGTRTKGNYIAVRLKDENIAGLHQQTAKDFIHSQLYGPGTNRTSANEFFSIANKKGSVKKAAVQFVDKSWGLEKKERATKFTKYWVAKKVTCAL